MDQNIDNRHKEILWDLLANPVENGQLYKHNLERLVQDNPQSGLLQVMYARSLQTPDIRTASAYFSPKVLHKLMHDPDGLLPVSRERINKHLNGSRPAEPENYFNIGQVTEAEATEVISEAPVTETESQLTQDYSHLADKFIPIEQLLPAHEEPQLLPEHEEEKTFETPAQEFVAELAPATGYINLQKEPQQIEQQPASQEIHSAPVETPKPVPAYEANTDDDEDDEFANPWDFAKLSKPEEIEVSKEEEIFEQPIEEIQPAPFIEAKQEPVVEQTPEPAVEKTPEPVAPPLQEEPKIETYDHSLSAFESLAVKQAAGEPKAEEEEVSSFDSYRTENVFHKQDYIEEDVYDEIVSIDEIGVESIGNTFADNSQQEDTHLEAPEADEETTAQQQSLIADETEKLIYGNIAATDYLSFDKKLDELRTGMVSATAAKQREHHVAEAPVTEATPVTPEPPVVETAATLVAMPAAQPQHQLAEANKEPEAVSKYDDNTLPYSFLWWLDKTRKEHAGSNQPYAEAQTTTANHTNNVKKVAPDELQQQYFANIFSLTSVSSIGDIETPKVAFDPAKKEDVIIERFIHTDPQIKPLAADKLGNENKARKSSEDQDAMVTETLARIYGDQMLYHKAIATYKKLMLKIPEKKLYFAAQIEQLEKKIN